MSVLSSEFSSELSTNRETRQLVSRADCVALVACLKDEQFLSQTFA